MRSIVSLPQHDNITSLILIILNFSLSLFVTPYWRSLRNHVPLEDRGSHQWQLFVISSNREVFKISDRRTKGNVWIDLR